MGVVNNVFFLDLNFLNKKGDEKLKQFAISEDLDVKDIISIIYHEAKRIGETDKVKVTFKMLDNSDDAFRVVVEPSYVKYKGTIVYPFDTIKSLDFELPLDCVCGKITLYNKKSEYKDMSLTIDGVGLDLFKMPYKTAKDFLIGISDRKGKNGYIEFPDSICFKHFGIKVNATKDMDGHALDNAPVSSVDVYNKEEFFKEYYFEEEKVQEEKYDVDINEVAKSITSIDEITEKKDSRYNYEIPKYEMPPMPEIPKFEMPQVDIPKVEIPDVEIPEVEIPPMEEQPQTPVEVVEKQEEIKEDVEENLEEYEKNVGNTTEEIVDEIEDPRIENINFADDSEFEIEIDVPQENRKVEEKAEIKVEPEVEEKAEEVIEVEIEEIELTPRQKELEELKELLKEEERQQKILEERIKAKLEELKREEEEEKNKNIIKFEKKEVIDSVEITEPEGYKSYSVVSYEGIKEQGNEKLAVFFGQNKKDIREYFGTEPKEVRDYDDMEIYDIFYAYYDELGSCTGIGIYNQEALEDKIALYFLNQNLITMKYKDIVALIKENDGSAIEDEDGIISLKYGISVDPKEVKNYQDEICDVIHIFKKGYYDEVYEIF
ncbi:MAG: hypothetical protein J6A15_02925 [Clostridia bacterium]|nr:hypothetical protein [Clostridia bacterium]